jgi:hypothetical protein
MIARNTAALLVSVLMFGSTLRASEEAFLPWTEVRIVCPKRDDTGQVVFHAKAEERKLLEMNIEAFGKKHAVAKEDLAKLAGFPLSSFVATHEAGYEILGGHTVHFKWKRIFYDAEGKLVEEQAIVSVSKGKGLSVNVPSRRAAKE